MREITKCKLCRRDLEISQFFKKCVNLGCTEYNKQIRRRNANRQKRQKNTIQSYEEE